MHYYEQQNKLGRWHPVKSPTKPRVKNDRLVRSEGLGARVRNVRELDERDTAHWPLSSLHEIFNPGKGD